MKCQEELFTERTTNDRAAGSTNTNAAKSGLRTSSISHEQEVPNSGTHARATFMVANVAAQVVVLALLA